MAGPEAANNAAAAGVLVPLLTLGLPTSATAAILLAAFQNYGLQPGPYLFLNNPDLVWGLIASLYIGNVMLLVLNLPLVGIWVRLLLIPRPWLYGGIMVFGIVGVYGLGASELDLAFMVLVGLAGYAMRVYDFPIAPALLGMILGPMAETQLRRALAIGQGSPWTLVESPLSATLLASRWPCCSSPPFSGGSARPERPRHVKVAYFSMEFGLHEEFPSYSGGLGVLAGDFLKGAHDLGLPVVGVGLRWAEGYTTQRLDAAGEPVDEWHEHRPDFLDDTGVRVTGPRRRSRRRVPRVARGPLRDRAALPPRADRAPGPVDHAPALRSPPRLPDRPGDAPRHRRGARAAAPPPRRQHVPLQRGPCRSSPASS